MGGLHRGERLIAPGGLPTGGAGPRRLRERRRGSPRGHRCRSRAVRAREQLHPTHALAALGALGWLAVGGAASLGAGAIHAAAIGVHSEHRQAVIAFTIVAAIQLGLGRARARPPGPRSSSRSARWPTSAIIGGWVLAKTNGISFIDGLGEAESPAAGRQPGGRPGRRRRARRRLPPLLLGLRVPSRAARCSPVSPAIVIASLAVPGMLSAGSHSHAGGHGEEGAAAHSHDGGAATEAAHTDAVVPPKAYDPTLPIDLGGVEGVTLAAAGGGREPPRRHASPTCRSSPTRPSPRAWASCRSATASSATSTT